MVIVLAIPAQAQLRVGIPSIQEADSMLAVGISQFEQDNYTNARAIFDVILNEYRDNAATTTAIIMAAKSAYRQAQYPEVGAYLDGFSSS